MMASSEKKYYVHTYGARYVDFNSLQENEMPYSIRYLIDYKAWP